MTSASPHGSGYKGVYQKRTGDQLDGCAVFWRAERLRLIRHRGLRFNGGAAVPRFDRDNVAVLVELEVASGGETHWGGGRGGWTRLSICGSVCGSRECICMHLSTYLPAYLPTCKSISIYPSVCPHLSVRPPIYPSTCRRQFIDRSICMCTCS